MSIPIRILNEVSRDIRATMHNSIGPMVSYRIPPNSTGPTMDMSSVHGIMITDDEAEVSVDPTAKTAVDELAPDTLAPAAT